MTLSFPVAFRDGAAGVDVVGIGGEAVEADGAEGEGVDKEGFSDDPPASGSGEPEQPVTKSVVATARERTPFMAGRG